MTDTLVRFSQVSKSFRKERFFRTVLSATRSLLKGDFRRSSQPEIPVLRKISFNIQTGDRVALLGSNGSGKTTLYRLLCGTFTPDSGEITCNCRVGALFGHSAGFMGDLDVRDNIPLFSALSGSRDDLSESEVNEIVEIAHLSSRAESSLKELSTGERQRLALSVLLYEPPELLILDEAFNGLDPKFASACRSLLKERVSSESALLISSHNTEILKAHCQSALWIEDGKIQQQGELETVLNEYLSSRDSD